MLWFLNTRSEPMGGDVCPVKVMDGELTHLTYPDLMSEVRGRHLLIGTHGFNVNQAEGVHHLREWNKLLELGSSGLFVGALWPGDSSWLAAMEYPFAAKSARRAGMELARFINRNFRFALSLSLVSHSLGARVVLEAIRALDQGFTVRRLVLMAPAVDDDCLTNEFADVATKVGEISILASTCDEVLKLAFPLGNPISGIFAQGHPYWHAALGREGPVRFPAPNNILAGWHIPNAWRVGHGDYLPPPSPLPLNFDPRPFVVPIELPAPDAHPPASGTPPVFQVGSEWKYWQSAWTAALTSSRFR